MTECNSSSAEEFETEVGDSDVEIGVHSGTSKGRGRIRRGFSRTGLGLVELQQEDQEEVVQEVVGVGHVVAKG